MQRRLAFIHFTLDSSVLEMSSIVKLPRRVLCAVLVDSWPQSTDGGVCECKCKATLHCRCSGDMFTPLISMSADLFIVLRFPCKSCKRLSTLATRRVIYTHNDRSTGSEYRVRTLLKRIDANLYMPLAHVAGENTCRWVMRLSTTRWRFFINIVTVILYTGRSNLSVAIANFLTMLQTKPLKVRLH